MISPKQILTEETMHKQAEIDARAETAATFLRLKQMTPTDKGAVAQNFCLNLAKQELDPSAHQNPSPRDDYDLVIMGKMIEVRLATEDTNEHFQFNGSIYNRHEEFFLLVGIERNNNIRFNIHPAESVKSGDLGKVTPMTKGQGEIGTQKFTRKKDQLYDISQFLAVMRNTLTPTPPAS